ncbi:MAG: methyl-accepting chemotaxis protein [Ktedonobacteraceae bacterium]
MDVGQTKLAKVQGNTALVSEAQNLVAEAERLKAREGARRLVFVCDNYDHLTPETAYRWLDPLAFQHEVEDARAQRVWLLHLIRNCVSILPLTLTWYALYLALTAYQNDTYAGDAGRSFLQLWQEGFHGGTWLPFSLAAIIDVGLLLLYLVLIGITSWTDGRAYTRSTEFAHQLQTTTEAMMQTVASSYAITDDQDAIHNVAAAVQQVVNEAMKANQQLITQVMNDNKQSLEGAIQLVQKLGQQFQDELTQIAQDVKTAITQVANESRDAVRESNSRSDTFFKRVSGSVNTFETSVKNLEDVLKDYQAKLDDIQLAISSMTAASSGLVANVSKYTQIGQDISENIIKLNKTMNSVLQQIGFVSKGITDAAGEMSKSALNMEDAAKQVEKVATQLDSGIQATLKTMYGEVSRSTAAMSDGVKQSVTVMNTNVSQAATTMSRDVTNAAQSLRDVAPALDQATTALQNTADQLGTLPFFGMNGNTPRGGSGGGGLLGGLFRQRNRRKQGQRKKKP